MHGMAHHIPSEFVRKPRAFSERLKEKATELRQFLLFTGPIVLRDVLLPQMYDTFMLLSVAIYILVSYSIVYKWMNWLIIFLWSIMACLVLRPSSVQHSWISASCW